MSVISLACASSSIRAAKTGRSLGSRHIGRAAAFRVPRARGEKGKRTRRRTALPSFPPRTMADGGPACEGGVMDIVDDAPAEDRLYLRAQAIREARRPGLWMPILRRLALRGHADAMI